MMLMLVWPLCYCWEANQCKQTMLITRCYNCVLLPIGRFIMRCCKICIHKWGCFCGACIQPHTHALLPVSGWKTGGPGLWNHMERWLSCMCASFIHPPELVCKHPFYMCVYTCVDWNTFRWSSSLLDMQASLDCSDLVEVRQAKNLYV